MKFLYRSDEVNKLVCEIDVNELAAVNEPSTMDEMIAEARLEYASGQIKGFSDTKSLIDHLNA